MSIPEGTDQARWSQRERLEAAVDGELNAETLEEVRRHALDCPDCAEELERLRRLKALLRRSCAGTVAPGSLRERISVQVRRIEVTRADGTRVTSVRMTSRRRRED